MPPVRPMIAADDTRHLGICVMHRQSFTRGADCPVCSMMVELDDQELTFDEATILGFDGTGRDGHPNFPWKVRHLTADQQTTLYALWTGDLCECGHAGYDGHDIRSVQSECLTLGCDCRQDT